LKVGGSGGAAREKQVDSAELEILRNNEKWQRIFAAILKQHARLTLLKGEAKKLEITVEHGGAYAHYWTNRGYNKELYFYGVTYKQKRRRTVTTFSKHFIIAFRHVYDTRDTKGLGPLKVHDVHMESLPKIPGIVTWLRGLCRRYEEAIEDRNAELQVFEDYADGLADLLIPEF